ncbi:MAG TPA: AAA family ATPase, partial [Protaetiibacter sp.]|nr:AAA family ATPase [Protaetiibacter sp.]
MHIEGWSIDAFGALADVERTGLHEGLTVVFGPNEAGKSTLRHFVLGALFGFPAGNTNYPRYSPPTGAVRSGRLYLSSDGEDFVLSRLEKKGSRAGELTLLGPDGKARGDAELTALLGGLNRKVYDKIFAIGLDELNDLGALTDGDLQDHLLSAGVTGAGRIATRARNDLRDRAGMIHRSRAQSTEVAAIREELRAVEMRLSEAQHAARDLGERRDALEAKRRRAADLADSERAADRAVQRAERLGELWPGYLEAADAQAELDAMAVDATTLPADSSERLTRALAAVETTSVEVATRTEDRNRTLAQLEVLEAGHVPDLAALQPDLAALQHRLSGWAQQEEEARTRSEELAELKRRLAAELDAVGVGDATELGRIGRVVAARDHLKVTRNAFDEKATARRRAADDVEMQSKEVFEAEAAAATASEAMETAPGDLSAQSLRIESDRAAREAMLLDRLTEDLKDLEGYRRDLAANEGSARGADQPGPGGSGGLQPRHILLGLAVVLVVAAVVGVVLAGIVAGVILGLAALVVAGASYAVAAGTGGDLDEGARRELTAKVDIIERKCVDTAQIIGFSGLPEMGQVAAAKAERDRQSGALTALVAADNRLSTARAAMRAKKEHLGELTRAHDRAFEAWQEWLAEHQLPPALRPEGVDEWLTHLDSARALAEQIRVAERRLNDLHSALEEAPKSVIELADRAEQASRSRQGGDGSNGLIPVTVTPPRVDSSIGELQAVVAAIAELVSQAAEAERDVSRVRDQAKVFRDELVRAERSSADARADLEATFAAAGVTDEVQLRRRLADHERRSVLARDIAAFERRLATESGSQSEADRTALAERTPDEWAAERTRALESARSLAAERDEVLREVGAIESEVASIEESADLPTLALEREALVERLARAIRSWTVLHLAAGLIDRTLERY